MDYMSGLQGDEEMEILAMIGRLADNGRMVNTVRFKKLTPTDIFEIKSYHNRVFCFFGHRQTDRRETLVLANAYRKDQEHTRRQEIDRAMRYRDRYFEED
jgi:hypothetical protein